MDNSSLFTLHSSLPKEFVTYTRELFGEEVWQKYLQSFEEPAPVSIRLNPFKPLLHPTSYIFPLTSPVPHCRNAYYLSERPNFTLDPLFHAGAYYVQEASSMYLDEILRQLFSIFNFQFSIILDLCAAPGGKSTLLRAAIPDDAMLYSNEPDHRRANILLENMQKQGHPHVAVTNNYPRDYQKAGILFDLILTDVPCSGEGMFRKDPATIKEWSVQNVMKCQQLQRSIVSDIWPCLKPGGILIYSTCTFNRHEDEENIEWIIDNLGAEILMPAKRFIPGVDRGEGLFMAVLRKTSDDIIKTKPNPKALRTLRSPLFEIVGNKEEASSIFHLPSAISHLPSSIFHLPSSLPRVELTREDALRYLRREAIVLPPDTPRGHVVVTYEKLPLGFVKNIGTRANNLYPKEWKIRNL